MAWLPLHSRRLNSVTQEVCSTLWSHSTHGVIVFKLKREWLLTSSLTCLLCRPILSASDPVTCSWTKASLLMQNCKRWRCWSILASLPSVIKNDHNYFSWICLAWTFRHWILLHPYQLLLNERLFILYIFCLHRSCIHPASLLFKDK